MLKNDILKTEYSSEADNERKKLVVQSYFKYGPAAKNFGDHMVEAINSCILCMNKYEETHNKEYILDAMNYLMFEYMYPEYSDAYFKHTDSNESAGVVGLPYEEAKKFKEEHANETRNI